MKHPLIQWRDRRGRLSALRIMALVLLATPLAIAAYDAPTIVHGARPLNDVIHRTGFWALVFVLVTLGITPLRRVARYGDLIDVRRMLGVGAFAYAATLFLLYVADQQFSLSKVVSEIALRLYLTIGFVALLGLIALAATSTDAMVRRLGGKRWTLLHQAIYLIALLAIVHYFQQTKAGVSVPALAAAFFAWLMGYRLIVKWRQRRAAPTPRAVRTSRGELPPLALVALTLAIAALTFVGEALGIAIAFHVSPLVVAPTLFNFDPENIRPGWIILASGFVVVLIDLVRGWWTRRAVREPSGPAAVQRA